VAASLAAAGVGVATLAPRAVVWPAHGAVVDPIRHVMVACGAALSTVELEQMLNTLLFLPFGTALALVLGRRWWWLAVPAGIAVSASIEWAQRSIPGRVSDAEDIVWNTLGMAVGALIGGLLALLRPRRGGARIRGV
jgi:hypothetical protein